MTIEFPGAERNAGWFTIEEVVHIARERTLNQGWHTPMVIAEGSRNSAMVMLEDFPQTHEEKVFQMFTTGAILAKSDEVGELYQVFFVCEGWMSTAGKNKPIIRRPSHDPDRKEVLLISHSRIKERRNGMVIFEMVRDVEGRLADLKEFQLAAEGEGGRVESPLLDAFVAGFRLGKGAKKSDKPIR